MSVRERERMRERGGRLNVLLINYVQLLDGTCAHAGYCAH